MFSIWKRGWPSLLFHFTISRSLLIRGHSKVVWWWCVRRWCLSRAGLLLISSSTVRTPEEWLYCIWLQLRVMRDSFRHSFAGGEEHTITTCHLDGTNWNASNFNAICVSLQHKACWQYWPRAGSRSSERRPLLLHSIGEQSVLFCAYCFLSIPLCVWQLFSLDFHRCGLVLWAILRRHWCFTSGIQEL